MKKYTLILLTTLMIIAVGCANDTTKKENVGSPFVGGDKGIIAEFLRSGVYSEADKIEEIFDKETFPLGIVFKNKGEANIVAGKAIIQELVIELGFIAETLSFFLPKTSEKIKECIRENKMPDKPLFPRKE